MRRYAPADEERILLQARVRDWTGAGLLTPEQGVLLESDLKVTLRRTGRMLRAGLAVFTLIAVAAAIGFVVLVADLDSDLSAGVALLLGSAACFAGADRLVVRYRLYRYGVEEALAVAAVALACFGIGLLMPTSGFSSRSAVVSALATGAIGGFEVYRRFGLRYAAVAAMACAACVPLQLRLPPPARILLASAVLAGIFATARRVRRAHHTDVTGEETRTLEAAAILGTYLMLNLEVSITWLGLAAAPVQWFKWTTYGLVWMLPVIIVWLGVRERERQLLDVGIVTLLVTLITNKLYLGIARNPWDPILFGVVVAGAAVAMRRWIAAGPGEARGGFTSVRVSGEEADVLAVIGTASAFHPSPDAHPDVDERTGFGGGRSGGAGSGADF